MIPLDLIRVPEDRITSVTPEGIFRELKDSISERGILQPLQIMKVGEELVLIDGLHRIMAAQQLAMSKVPCIVREGTEDIMLIENLILNRQRGKSDPVGEGLVLRALVNEHKMTLGAACRAANVSQTWGRKLFAIIALPDLIKELVTKGSLAVGSAAHLLALDNPEKAVEVAMDAVKYGYTVEQTKGRVLVLLNPDHDQPVGGYEFTETGQPQKVLPDCFLCGEGIADRAKVVYFHYEHYEQLKQTLQELDQAEEEPGPPLSLQPPSYPPPVTPQLNRQLRESMQHYGQQRYPSQYSPPVQPQPPIQQQPPTVTVQQLQCSHQFQENTAGVLYCPICRLTVNTR